MKNICILIFLLGAFGATAQTEQITAKHLRATQKWTLDTVSFTRILKVITVAATHNQGVTAKAVYDFVQDEIAGVTITDGDKGDIDVTSGGNVWTVDTSAITTVKVAPNAIDSTKVINAGLSVLDLGQHGATSGQALKWNGTQWAPADDTGITGSGVSGRVTYWNGATSVTSHANYTFNATGGASTPHLRLRSSTTQFQPVYRADSLAADGIGFQARAFSTSGSAFSALTGTASATTGTQDISINLTNSSTNAASYSFLSMNSSGGGSITKYNAGANTYFAGNDAGVFKINWTNVDAFSTAGINISSTTSDVGIGAINSTGQKFYVSGGIRFNLGSDATGDIFYRNSSGNFTRLPIGDTDDVLTVAAGLPSWAPQADGGWGAQVVETDATLIGDGTSGDPLGWYGAYVDGPLTGNGLNATPIDVLNLGITEQYIGASAVTSSKIRDTTIVTDDLKDAAVTGAKIAQAGATSGQALKWNGSTWAPADDTGGVTDHGALTGLADDDHTQYALLAGRSGGQTLTGGTASGNNLTLNSTSNSTKGAVLIGTDNSPTVVGTSLYYRGDLAPSALSADTDNWNPAGLDTAQTLRISSTDTVSLTGIQGGSDGRILYIFNIGESPITLKDNTTSTSAYRFEFDADIELRAGQGVILRYDGTASKWRAAGSSTWARSAVSYLYTTDQVNTAVTVPTGARMVSVVCVGGGGGGGSGRRGAAGSIRGGGSGGQGGAVSECTFAINDLGNPTTIYINVGAGGGGGTAATSDDTDGANGTDGGDSDARTTTSSGDRFISAGGGNNGSAGDNNGSTASSYGIDIGMFGAGGGGGSSATGGNGSTSANNGWTSGGGGGGGVTSGDSASNGGQAGSACQNLYTTGGSGSGGASGTNGSAATLVTTRLFGRGGGGGGGGSAGTGGTGGNGIRGGGGGGGGASTNGSNSGAGGDGGDGLVRLIFYF